MDESKYPQAGEQWWFEYHCWKSPESQHAELWRHTKQPITILHRILDVDEEDIGGPMYNVRFGDGFEHDVFYDELVRKIK